MSKRVKYGAYVVAAAVVLALVTGVAYLSLNMGASREEPGLVVNGELLQDPSTIVTVGDHEVDINLYRYFYLTTKFYFTYEDANYFEFDPDGSLKAELLESVETYMLNWFSWLDIAEQRGVTLTDEELQEINDVIEEDKAIYGSTFQDRLDSIFVSDEETYLSIMQQQTLIEKVRDNLYDELLEENREEILSGAVTAQHILITPTNEALTDGTALENTAADDADEGEEMDGEEPEDTDGGEQEDADEEAEGTTENETEGADTTELARQFAYQLLGNIRANADPVAQFLEYRELYDDDAEGQATYDGYTFVEGDMVDEFYQAALALKVDEISDPVETVYGFHIIRRLALDQSYIDENYEDMAYYVIYEQYNSIYYDVYDNLAITPGQYYDKIGPETVK